MLFLQFCDIKKVDKNNEQTGIDVRTDRWIAIHSDGRVSRHAPSRKTTPEDSDKVFWKHVGVCVLGTIAITVITCVGLVIWSNFEHAPIRVPVTLDTANQVLGLEKGQ